MNNKMKRTYSVTLSIPLSLYLFTQSPISASQFQVEVDGKKASYPNESPLLTNVEGSIEQGNGVGKSSVREKGTWIWDARIIKTERKEILDFAIENKLTTIYLHIDIDLKMHDYQQFISDAHSQQIVVEALAGKPSWVFKEQQPKIKEFIHWVETYNAVVQPNERFHGFHFDIEPYILKQWKTEQTEVLKKWVEALQFIESETKKSGLKVTLDVPFWIYKYQVPYSNYTFSSWMLKTFDCLVIMNYRNFSLGNNGIVAIAQPLMLEASLLNKAVTIAVDTTPSKEGDHVSFHRIGTLKMEEEIRITFEELSNLSSFAGMAIHDYKNWSLLKKGEEK